MTQRSPSQCIASGATTPLSTGEPLHDLIPKPRRQFAQCFGKGPVRDRGEAKAAMNRAGHAGG